MTRKVLVLSALFIACIVAANVVTAIFDRIPVAPGVMATAGTYFAGLTFIVRDELQRSERAHGRRIPWLTLAVIVAGAALSYVASSPALAIASGAAFLLSEALDLGVYTPLEQHGYGRAAFASNIVGAFVDTAVFLWLAAPFLSRVDPHFTVSGSFAGQIIGKLTVTAVFVTPLVIVRLRRGTAVPA